MNVLDVNQLVPQNKQKTACNHILAPQHDTSVGSFRWLISGRSGTGKTNLVVSALMQAQVRFDHLYLYARDPSQPKYQLLLKWINHLEKAFEKDTGEKVSMATVVDKPENIVPVDELSPDIVNIALFDDMLLEKHQEMIKEYFVRGRHRGVNCIYLTQDYHRTDMTIRKQCDYFSIFGVSSKSELVQLSKDHSLMHDFKTFKDILSKATAHKTDFLFIDRRSDLDFLQLRKNFDHIWNPETQQFELITEELVCLVSDNANILL